MCHDHAKPPREMGWGGGGCEGALPHKLPACFRIDKLSFQRFLLSTAGISSTAAVSVHLIYTAKINLRVNVWNIFSPTAIGLDFKSSLEVNLWLYPSRLFQVTYGKLWHCA